ncbi:Zinc knuckle family protein [Aphelenchoides avenae]|nr:Zinc knuckle family protein [Aphelenchus avenae]
MSHEERHSRGSHHSSERRHYGSKPYPSPSPERRPLSSDSPDKAYRRHSPGTSGRRTPGDRRRPRRPDCVFCKGGHCNESCQKYPSAEDRRQVLKRYARCFRCFGGGHSSKKCQVRLSPCRHCKGIHNSALCNQHFPRRERRPETPELVILDDDEPIGDAPLETEEVSRSPPQPLRIAEEAYFNVAPSSPSSSESELQIDDIGDRDSPSPTQEATARPTVSTKSSNWKKFLPPPAPCGFEDEPGAESLENCDDPDAQAGRPASSSFDVADEWNSSNDKSTVSSPHVGGSSDRTPCVPTKRSHPDDSSNRERRTSESVFSEKPPDEERSDLEKERLRLAQIKLKLEEDKLAIQGQQQALLDMEADLKRDEDDLRAGNAKLNSDKATLEADRKQLEDERKEFKQALSDQQSTLAKWSEELEAQQKRADEREKELNRRQMDIEASEKEIEDAQRNLQADQTVLINDQSALRVKETKLEADLAELNNLAEALKTAQEELEQAQAKLGSEQAELKRERAELERELAELHKERPECSRGEQPADQADELAATKAELNDLKTLFTQQSAVLAEAHRRLAAQFDKRRRLRALLLQSEADGEHCQAEKEALQLALEFREQLYKSHEDTEKAAKAAHPTATSVAATPGPSSSTTLGKRPHPADHAQSANSVKRSRQPSDSDAVEGLKLKLAPLESHFTEAHLAKGIEFVSVNLLDGVAPLYELLDFLTGVDPTMSAFAERARELV